MTRRKKKTEYPTVMETFLPPGPMLTKQGEPSCWNGMVRARKYRVTVEVIDEPTGVVAGRLQKMWEESDNIHHMDPLKTAAREIGYELQGRWGNKKTR